MVDRSIMTNSVAVDPQDNELNLAAGSEGEAGTTPIPSDVTVLTGPESSPETDSAVERAAAAGDEILAKLRGGVATQILAYGLIDAVVTAIGNDDLALTALLQRLHEGRIISMSDFRLGRRSPKLSRLRGIGANAEWLCSDGILKHLVPAPSIIYMVVVLRGYLEKAGDTDPTAAVAKILSERPSDELSQDYLEQQNRAFRNKPNNVNGKAVASGSTKQVNAAVGVERKPHVDIAGPREAYDVVLFTPGEGDAGLLRADYVEPDAMSRALRLEGSTFGEAVALVVITRVCYISTVARVLLELGGFRGPSSVLLLGMPPSPDIIDLEVIVTASRGDVKLHAPHNMEWLDQEEPVTAKAIAERLYPSAGRKLHVFAQDRQDGWDSLIGDDSWVEKPSLK